MPYSAGGRPRSLSPGQAQTARRARTPGRSCSPAWPNRRQPACRASPGRLIEGHLATRTWPYRLESLDAAFDSELAATLTRCLDSAVAALAGFLPPAARRRASTGSSGASSSSARCGALSPSWPRSSPGTATAPGSRPPRPSSPRPRHPERARRPSRPAGPPRSAWPPATRASGAWLAGQLDAAPGLLREVLRDLASDPGPLTDHLTADELGELWELLARYWPYQAGGESWSSGFVGRDEQARHWRDGVPSVLARRGTADAVRVLRQLAASHPGIPSLADLTREAEELRLGQDWSPVRAEELTSLLEDSTKRLVRSSSDLADLVHRGILEAAGTLVRTGQLLWDVRTQGQERDLAAEERGRVRRLARRPAARAARSGRGRHQPRGARPGNDHPARPGGRHPGRRPGHRRPAGRAGPLPHRAQGKLARGPDDRDAHPARRRLPHPRKAPSRHLRHSVVRHRPLERSADDRRRTARSRDQDQTAAELASQAETLRDLGLDVRSAVVYIPRPAKSARRDP